MITARLVKLKLLLLSFLIVLSGCVTESTDGKARNHVNKEEAFRLHIQLARGYVDKKNRESARHHVRKAMDIDKNSADVFNVLALVYQMEGENELAEQTFKKAISKRKNFSTAQNDYGVFLYGIKRYEDALVQFESAASNLDFDGRAESLVNVGRCATLLGKSARAKAAFEHASILNRGMPDPLIELAEINFIEQDYPKAKEFLDRYMALGVQSARSLLMAIRLERMYGNKDKEASYALLLKNRYPYSKEYLEYRQTLKH